MARIILTEPAIEDINAIRKFISRDSPKIADIFVSQIFSSIKTLEKFPFLGKLLNRTLKPNYRYILYKSYRIVYKIDEKKDIAYIMTVIHGSRIKS